MAEIGLTYGITANDIPFVRWGCGRKTLLVWSGGPGNMIPKGGLLKRFSTGLDPLLSAYTIVLLTRRLGLSEGYTTRDMSDDYAQYIKAEHEGHVDLIIGFSYGGIIAQHFAADHPDLCDRMVICAAAYKVSDVGMDLDYRFAELLSENKPRQALALMSGALVKNVVAAALMRPVLWLLGPILLGEANTAVFRRDALIEAQAEVDHDGRECLSRITIPTLVLAGEHDHYFPLEFFRETVTLIPDGKLIIYPGKGHDLLGDPEAANDILTWVGSGG